MYNYLKKIYEALQDEESRIIFESRCLFSLSGDMCHISKMVQKLIDRYRQCDQMYDLLQWLDRREKKYLVVFGAGFAGREVVTALEVFGRVVSFICDNDVSLHGVERYGKKIVSADQLNEIKNDVNVILGTNLYVEDIRSQLNTMGVSCDNIYVQYKEWWLGNERQYFDSQIMRPKENEIFIDGGSFRGEDTLAFIMWCKSKYEKIYIFEPDKLNYQKICRDFSGFERNKISILNKGLWNQENTMNFSSNKYASSHVAKEGTVQIQVNSIDAILQGNKASFIKMDIEGCEMEALRGACYTIRQYRPKLAICVYHKPEDIFEIPLEILKINPDYLLYLRHYSYIFTETVLYAV